MAKEKKEIEFTHTALTVFQDPTTKDWCVAQIKFDPLTGSTAFDKATSFGPHLMDACERFKILAVETGSVL